MPTPQQSRLLLQPRPSGVIAAYTDVATSYGWYEGWRQTGYVNNDPVGSITDLSGSGNDLIQAVGLSKPTYLTAGPNGKAIFSFDGGDCCIKTTAAGIVAGAFTFLTVVERVSSGSRRTIFYAGDVTNGGRQVVIDSSEKFRATKSQVAEIAGSSANVSNSAYEAWLLTYDGNTWSFYRNNVLDSTGSNAQSFVDTVPVIYLGANSALGELMNGGIALAVAFGSVLSAVDITRVFARANYDYTLY